MYVSISHFTNAAVCINIRIMHTEIHANLIPFFTYATLIYQYSSILAYTIGHFKYVINSHIS